MLVVTRLRDSSHGSWLSMAHVSFSCTAKFIFAELELMKQQFHLS